MTFKKRFSVTWKPSLSKISSLKKGPSFGYRPFTETHPHIATPPLKQPELVSKDLHHVMNLKFVRYEVEILCVKFLTSLGPIPVVLAVGIAINSKIGAPIAVYHPLPLCVSVLILVGPQTLLSIWFAVLLNSPRVDYELSMCTTPSNMIRFVQSTCGPQSHKNSVQKDSRVTERIYAQLVFAYGPLRTLKLVWNVHFSYRSQFVELTSFSSS